MRINKLKKGRKRMILLKVIGNLAVFVLVLSSGIAAYVYIYSRPVALLFPVKNILFSGNTHLTDDELRALAGIHTNEGLLSLSNKKLCERLLKSPWVETVSVRKEFPDTLAFAIKEAEPFALLDMNRHLFLMDESGKLLEELKHTSIPFLPVITGDPFKDKEGFQEALKLAKLMHEKGFASERDQIEITAEKPNEITVTIDGTVVKIGAGDYEEKLKRFVQLERDVREMGIPIDYIDLRFREKAIVKPVVQNMSQKADK